MTRGSVVDNKLVLARRGIAKRQRGLFTYAQALEEHRTSDVTVVGCIPATSPVRTVIDVAGEMQPRAIERLIDKVVSRQLARVTSLERRARELAAPGRPGAARVLRALATAHPDLERTRNEYEAAVLRICDTYGLPLPIPNYEIRLNGHKRFHRR